MKKTKIYLAARFEKKDLIKKYNKELEKLGICPTSNWAYQEEIAPEDLTKKELHSIYKKYAEDDLKDIDRADALVLSAENPEEKFLRGGRHVEFGYAIAKQKKIYVIGYIENIFHTLDEVMFFETWEKFLEFIKIDEDKKNYPYKKFSNKINIFLNIFNTQIKERSMHEELLSLDYFPDTRFSMYTTHFALNEICFKTNIKNKAVFGLRLYRNYKIKQKGIYIPSLPTIVT